MKITSILGIALTVISTSLAAPDCGKGIGICPEGKCCSKYGYCGTSTDHCDNAKGCQTEYGVCTGSQSKGRCGKDYGRCAKSNYCCSQSGYCGTSSDYCGTGCQASYGICGSDPVEEVEEEVEWVTEWVTETVYVYVEEKEDSRDCGSDVGKKCSSGKCCSKYGYCGTSSEYCEVSKGCQATYGDCYEYVDFASVSNVEPSVPECGKGIGSCVDGECCSKYGYCGKTAEYCDVEQGCQSEFGLCNSQSKNGECGENFGRCPQPTHCCSKNGYCGVSEDYCAKVNGCQADYGLCVDFDVDAYESEMETETESAAPAEPECGEGIGSCPDGKCCSKYGFCGLTFEYCKADQGCQKDYGECFSESTIGKCGEGFGRCPSSEQCCSKEGFCGTTEHYCLPDNGCQANYGKCDSTVSDEFQL